jgi:hypothetical protein
MPKNFKEIKSFYYESKKIEKSLDLSSKKIIFKGI